MKEENFEGGVGQPKSENDSSVVQTAETPADFKLETHADTPVDEARLEEVRKGLTPDWAESPLVDIPITVKDVTGGVTENTKPKNKKSLFGRIVASISMAGILGGAFSDKALADDEKNSNVAPDKTPIFSSGERPSDAGQIFSAGERQGNWVADSNMTGNPGVRQEINRVPAQPNTAVESKKVIGGGRTVKGGNAYVGGGVRPGETYRGNFVSPGIGGGPRIPQGPRYYDRVEGNAGGATWVHEVGNNSGNRYQARQNDRIDKIYEQSGGTFIGSHADNERPVHRNPFNPKSWFNRGR